MGTRTEAFASVLSSTLGREKSVVRKTVRQDAKGLVAGRLERKSAEAPVKAARKLPAGRVPRKVEVGAVPKRKTEDIRALFESDVEMRNAVEKGRRDARPADLSKRDQRIERFKRVAADSPKSVNALLSFGLGDQQARTLDQLLGQFFGEPIKLVGRQETREAQDAANKLIAAMKQHWDDAVPSGETRASLLKKVYAEYRAELKVRPDTSPQFIRAKLFDPWRKRFMASLGKDAALIAELRTATGIGIVTESGVTKFELRLKMGNTQAKLGFDVDHAETRLSDAVRNAKRPEDLLSVIDSDGMQLLTPRENRREIEALRKATREYFDRADDAAVTYFRRNGTSATKLNADVDRMLDVLDRPGDLL
jgi:hypothetical protein